MSYTVHDYKFRLKLNYENSRFIDYDTQTAYNHIIEKYNEYIILNKFYKYLLLHFISPEEAICLKQCGYNIKVKENTPTSYCNDYYNFKLSDDLTETIKLKCNVNTYTTIPDEIYIKSNSFMNISTYCTNEYFNRNGVYHLFSYYDVLFNLSDKVKFEIINGYIKHNSIIIRINDEYIRDNNNDIEIDIDSNIEEIIESIIEKAFNILKHNGK